MRDGMTRCEEWDLFSPATLDDIWRALTSNPPLEIAGFPTKAVVTALADANTRLKPGTVGRRHYAPIIGALRREIYGRAQSVECFNCGASAGSTCKPDYGCSDSERALGHALPRVPAKRHNDERAAENAASHEVDNARRDAERAAAHLIAEHQWRVPASYEMFVAMVATAYLCGQRDQLAEIVYGRLAS